MYSAGFRRKFLKRIEIVRNMSFGSLDFGMRNLRWISKPNSETFPEFFFFSLVGPRSIAPTVSGTSRPVFARVCVAPSHSPLKRLVSSGRRAGRRLSLAPWRGAPATNAPGPGARWSPERSPKNRAAEGGRAARSRTPRRPLLGQSGSAQGRSGQPGPGQRKGGPETPWKRKAMNEHNLTLSDVVMRPGPHWSRRLIICVMCVLNRVALSVFSRSGPPFLSRIRAGPPVVSGSRAARPGAGPAARPFRNPENHAHPPPQTPERSRLRSRLRSGRF